MVFPFADSDAAQIENLRARDSTADHEMHKFRTPSSSGDKMAEMDASAKVELPPR